MLVESGRLELWRRRRGRKRRRIDRVAVRDRGILRIAVVPKKFNSLSFDVLSEGAIADSSDHSV